MKSIKIYVYSLTYLQGIGLHTNIFGYMRKINAMFAMKLSILLIAHGLQGCYSLHPAPTPDLKNSPNTTEQLVKFETNHTTNKANHTPNEKNHASNDWILALLLAPSERKKALSLVNTPSNNQQTWLRVFLLTHDKASYRELREAEQLLQIKLNSQNIESSEYGSQALHDYILKLNLYFQKNKSEVVLLQRKLNARDRSIKTQKLVNEVLENKIEALTNIEQRMKLRPNKIEAEMTP